MTKRFCDLCGEPAVGELALELAAPFKPEYPSEVQRSEEGRPRITLRVNFGFRNHPTGYGGPPDLCHKCRAKLLYKLLVLAAGSTSAIKELSKS